MSAIKNKPVAALRVLVECAQDQGFDIERILLDTDLSAAELINPETMISQDQEVTAIRNLLAQSSHPIGLGITFGDAFQITTLGIWGFAIISSETVRQAYDTTMRFAQLGYVLADSQYEPDPNDFVTLVKLDHLPEDVRPFVFERSFGVIRRFLMEMLPTLNVENFVLEVRSDAHYAQSLSERSRTKVIGNGADYRIKFSKAFADHPLPKADPATRAYCIDQCQKLLDAISPNEASLTQSVRTLIVDKIDDVPSLSRVAFALNMSDRTLRRKLRDEGVSFRDIVLDARMSLARELLLTAKLPVKAVGYQLGYSEPAAFVRAFTKWYGVSPGQADKIELITH